MTSNNLFFASPAAQALDAMKPDDRSHVVKVLSDKLSTRRRARLRSLDVVAITGTKYFEVPVGDQVAVLREMTREERKKSPESASNSYLVADVVPAEQAGGGARSGPVGVNPPARRSPA